MSSYDLRATIERDLKATLDRRRVAFAAGEGYTGLDGQIRNLAAALRELDMALAFAEAVKSGAPLFSLNVREVLDEAQVRG